MDLVLYNGLEEFVDDLVKLSVIENKDSEKFLEEVKQLKVITVFLDTKKGEFPCYMFLKNKKTIDEYELIDSIVTAWARYCGTDDADILVNLKTCSVVSHSILKGLNK